LGIRAMFYNENDWNIDEKALKNIASLVSTLPSKCGGMKKPIRIQAQC